MSPTKKAETDDNDEPKPDIKPNGTIPNGTKPYNDTNPNYTLYHFYHKHNHNNDINPDKKA